MVEARTNCVDPTAVELTSLLTQITAEQNIGFVLSGSSQLGDLRCYLFPQGLYTGQLDDLKGSVEERLKEEGKYVKTKDVKPKEKGYFRFPLFRVPVGDDIVIGILYPTQEYAEAVRDNDCRRYELSRLPMEPENIRTEASEKLRKLELRYPKFKIGVNKLREFQKSE